MMNLKGIGLPQNEKKAAVKFRKMATFGPTDLQAEFGKDYRSIMKTKPRPKPYVAGTIETKGETHRLAVDSAYQLGLLHLEGNGAKKDRDAAIRWLEVASKSDHPRAQYTLGKLLLETESKTVNRIRGMDLLRTSADAGNADAQYQLGQMYFSGDRSGLEKDQVVDWLRKAANQSHSEAIHLLNRERIDWKRDKQNPPIPAQDELDTDTLHLVGGMLG